MIGAGPNYFKADMRIPPTAAIKHRSSWSHLALTVNRVQDDLKSTKGLSCYPSVNSIDEMSDESECSFSQDKDCHWLESWVSSEGMPAWNNSETSREAKWSSRENARRTKYKDGKDCSSGRNAEEALRSRWVPPCKSMPEAFKFNTPFDHIEDHDDSTFPQHDFRTHEPAWRAVFETHTAQAKDQADRWRSGMDSTLIFVSSSCLSPTVYFVMRVLNQGCTIRLSHNNISDPRVAKSFTESRWPHQLDSEQSDKYCIRNCGVEWP